MVLAPSWDETHFGRDDGIRCSYCGGTTYLVGDHGSGYCSYTCDDCGESFAVQYEVETEDDHEDFWDYPDDLEEAPHAD